MSEEIKLNKLSRDSCNLYINGFTIYIEVSDSFDNMPYVQYQSENISKDTYLILRSLPKIKKIMTKDQAISWAHKEFKFKGVGLSDDLLSTIEQVYNQGVLNG